MLYLHLLDPVSFPPRTAFDSSVQVHYTTAPEVLPPHDRISEGARSDLGCMNVESLGELWSGCKGRNFKSEKYVFRIGRCSNKLHIYYISIIYSSICTHKLVFYVLFM